jgi:hypothetical protein
LVGLLTYLTYKGVLIDAGRLTGVVADELRKDVLDTYPKPAAGRYIADAIIEHANRSSAAAPPGSLAAYCFFNSGRSRSNGPNARRTNDGPGRRRVSELPDTEGRD